MDGEKHLFDDVKNSEWGKMFDERQVKEIVFARMYAQDFAHGTDGHNGKLIIAKMANLLDQYELATKQSIG